MMYNIKYQIVKKLSLLGHGFYDIIKQNEVKVMQENMYKSICKYFLENGNNYIKESDKELIKNAIDESKSISEIVYTSLMSVILLG